MQLPGGRNDIYILSEELLVDACDEDLFDQRVWAPLQIVRSFSGDGLFTRLDRRAELAKSTQHSHSKFQSKSDAELSFHDENIRYQIITFLIADR
ncbi:hypothetical protein XI25_04030 [Paenibacillus sp. DMB20]|nr:hypothetical protein XI25_04030 [Paenibacillus sp. DMB20]